MPRVGSARALARLCERHDAYRWICDGVEVSAHTLSDFSRPLAGMSRSGVPLDPTKACVVANTRDYLVRCMEERVLGVDEYLTAIASTDPCDERRQLHCVLDAKNFLAA